MAFESTYKVVLGSFAFSIFWVLAVFPAVPFLPIGRTAGSLLGAMLMVVFGVLSPDQAYAAIDLPILGLLFGTMVVSAFLEQADMFVYLGKLLSWKSRGGKDLLFRVCLISAFSSALFTNDTVCVVLTEFVLKIARQNNLPVRPFLLALASSANIGSSATPIGNPQNLVIAVQSGISFGAFLKGLIGAMLVGVLVNASILVVCFWKVLSLEAKDIEATSVVPEDLEADKVVIYHRFSPATMSHQTSFGSQDLDTVLSLEGVGCIGDISFRSRPHTNDTTEIEPSAPAAIVTGEPNVSVDGTATRPSLVPNGSSRRVASIEEKEVASGGWKKNGWKILVYLVTLGMLVALLMGLNLSWTAITAALVLVAIDFKDAEPCLEKVVFYLNSGPDYIYLYIHTSDCIFHTMHLMISLPRKINIVYRHTLTKESCCCCTCRYHTPC
jgi:Na+/H+ antiporter NhaD/arsenite permease-like protein